MEFDERIRRMQANGILTPAQADKLRNSIAVSSTDTEIAALAKTRRHVIVWVVLLMAVTVLLLILLLLTTTGSVQEIQDVSKTMNEVGDLGAMNKTLSSILTIGLILIIPLVAWVWIHNSLVSKEEDVLSSWAQVESNYQRRSDLVPALIESVSRYLKHEKETLSDVTKQRNINTSGEIINDLVNAQKSGGDLLKSIAGKPPTDDLILKQLSDVQEKIGLGMRRLVAVLESYPELRSSEQFVELQAQLEGTENRINVARMRFNESVNTFNSAIRKVPGNLVAGVGGFVRKAYFKADEGANKVQPLNFK